MPRSDRKQRELKQREALIIETARQQLLEVGYLDLSMDRIAERTEYSKGTMYQHFSCKEEILVAMLIESGRKVGELLERGSTFPGKPRERIAAMALGYGLFMRLNPDHFKAELLVQNESIRGKASAFMRKQLDGVEQHNIDTVSGVVRDGIAQGHLTPKQGLASEQITFGLWSGAFGAYVLMSSEINLAAMGIADARKATWDNMHALLDGFGWHPLTSQLDYGNVRARVLREIYPQESKRAGLA